MRRQIFYFGGLAVMLALAVLLIIVFLQPSREDLQLFVLLLATPVVVAALGALLAQRQAWWRQFRSVVVALVITYAISAGLILLTVYITTQLMFLSAHDATLALVIVVFATAVTLVFGYFVANSLSDGINNITRAAQRVQGGDLEARADDKGSDELAQLARAFNAMTAQLRQVREQEQSLDQARRDLIAWVSHDLRTPLTALRARVEALADGMVTEPAEVTAYMSAVRADTNALNQLIDDLFELATIEAGGLRLELQECNLSDLISDTIESMGVIAESRGIALSGEMQGDLGVVRISPQHIQRVLNNLVSNALTHTPRGSVVRVEARRDASASAISVCVRDEGEGIASEDLSRVFEQFYRGERARTRANAPADSHAGMGLGLAIARSLVEAHRGQISIQSALGQGTTVCFTLPV